MVGYVENSNWRWNAVYFQGFSESSFCTWSMPCISGTRPPVIEWPSWSYMANIANYFKLNYGAYNPVQKQGEWKWSELTGNRMGNGLHKLFKAVVNKLKK